MSIRRGVRTRPGRQASPGDLLDCTNSKDTSLLPRVPSAALLWHLAVCCASRPANRHSPKQKTKPSILRELVPLKLNCNTARVADWPRTLTNMPGTVALWQPHSILFQQALMTCLSYDGKVASARWMFLGIMPGKMGQFLKGLWRVIQWPRVHLFSEI